MFKTLRNALKIKDIRKKLIFTFFMLVVVRFGSQLPIPGVTETYFQHGLRSRPLMRSISLMRLPVDRSPACLFSH